MSRRAENCRNHSSMVHIFIVVAGKSVNGTTKGQENDTRRSRDVFHGQINTCARELWESEGETWHAAFSQMRHLTRKKNHKAHDLKMVFQPTTNKEEPHRRHLVSSETLCVIKNCRSSVHFAQSRDISPSMDPKHSDPRILGFDGRSWPQPRELCPVFLARPQSSPKYASDQQLRLSAPSWMAASQVSVEILTMPAPPTETVLSGGSRPTGFNRSPRLCTPRSPTLGTTPPSRTPSHPHSCSSFGLPPLAGTVHFPQGPLRHSSPRNTRLMFEHLLCDDDPDVDVQSNFDHFGDDTLHRCWVCQKHRVAESPPTNSNSKGKNHNCLMSRAYGSLKPLKMMWCAFQHDHRKPWRREANLKWLDIWTLSCVARGVWDCALWSREVCPGYWSGQRFGKGYGFLGTGLSTSRARVAAAQPWERPAPQLRINEGFVFGSCKNKRWRWPNPPNVEKNKCPPAGHCVAIAMKTSSPRRGTTKEITFCSEYIEQKSPARPWPTSMESSSAFAHDPPARRKRLEGMCFPSRLG